MADSDFTTAAFRDAVAQMVLPYGVDRASWLAGIRAGWDAALARPAGPITAVDCARCDGEGVTEGPPDADGIPTSVTCKRCAGLGSLNLHRPAGDAGALAFGVVSSTGKCFETFLAANDAHAKADAANMAGYGGGPFRVVPLAPLTTGVAALERKIRADESRAWIDVLREYAVLLGIDTSREGDEPGQVQILHAIEALKRRAGGAEAMRHECAEIARRGAVAAYEAMAAAPRDGAQQYTRADVMEAVGAALDECEAQIRALPLAAPSRVEEASALFDWLDERVGDGRGNVQFGLTENGGVGCWLPGDETVPEGESVEEAIRFRMERHAAKCKKGGAHG